PGSGGDRPLRSAAGQLRGAYRDRQTRTHEWSRLLRSKQARASSEGEGGRRVRQRRGNAAAAPDVGQRAVSTRTGELERAGRQVPDVQLLVARARRVRTRAERIQERPGFAYRPRLLRCRSEA